jgi:chaperone modulatory protein CbpM
MKRQFALTEACEELGVEQSFVIHCIRLHWITPALPEQSLLDEEDLARLRLIRELREDFGANEEAIPLILHLLDQLYELRAIIKKSAA